MTFVDTLAGYEINDEDPYTVLGQWYWVAVDPDSGDWIALTMGDESYENLVRAMEAEDEDYEIITVGWDKDQTGIFKSLSLV